MKKCKTTIKVKLHPSTAKGRLSTIVYAVTRHHKIRQITTDYKLFINEWNDEQATITVPNNSNRKSILNSISQRIRWDMDIFKEIIKNLDSLKADYTSDDVIFEFQRIAKQNSFFNYMEAIITRYAQWGHVGTSRNYRSTLNSFKRFLYGKDVLIEQINYSMIEDYQSWLKSNGKVQNSITFYMRNLRAVYNRAVDDELTIDRKPFRKASITIERNKKRTLDLKDIKQIKDLDLTLKPSLAFTRDIFIFLFLCRGMSFIDAAYLKKSNINNGIITYHRHKTTQQLQIKIIKQMQDIIDCYINNNSPYIFPIIAMPGNDERKQYETALRRINNHLKKIGKMLNLPLSLTTYTSRHSWATIAKQKGIPIATISDALGHDSQITTEIYLASISTSVIDKANDLITRDL